MGIRSLRERGTKILEKGDLSPCKILIRLIQRVGVGGGGGVGVGGCPPLADSTSRGWGGVWA